jgi:hypothetical protein
MGFKLQGIVLSRFFFNLKFKGRKRKHDCQHGSKILKLFWQIQRFETTRLQTVKPRLLFYTPPYSLKTDCRISVRIMVLRPPLWSSSQSSWLHNGDVLSFLWGTNWIYICYVEESRPPLWSSAQSSWLHNWDVLCFLWGTNWIYMLCRRK